jgi:hypothetical protein
MTSPSEAEMNQMAAEDEAGMLERIPVPAEPLPAENPEIPTEMLERVAVPAEPLPAEDAEFPAARATASPSAR